MVEPRTPVLRVADAARLGAIWPAMALPMASYLAACHWTVPMDVEAAIRWFLSAPRVTLVPNDLSQRIVAALRPLPDTQVAELIVLSQSGVDHDAIGTIMGDLVRVACHDLAQRRCELHLLAGWSRARSAAAALGFREEARFGGCCLVEGRTEDVLLLGLHADEWGPR